MKTCPICSRGPAGTKYAFDSHSIYECPACGLLFLSPQPSFEESRRIYGSEDYFLNKDFFAGANDRIYGYSDYFAERAYRQKQFSRIAARCLRALAAGGRPVPAKGFRLLEIGCGPGFFLAEALRHGFDAEGIEFNSDIVALADRTVAGRVRVADFENIDESGLGKFDCVVMLDVLEHFRDPVKVIRKVGNLLSPGGIFILSTVDSGSTVSRLLGKKLEDLRRLREHFFFFNRKNISSLLRENDMAVDSISSIGNTFRLDLLLNRILLMYRRPRFMSGRIGTAFMRALSRASIYLNPRTKMILYSRRLGPDRGAAAERTRADLLLMSGAPGYYRYHLDHLRDTFRDKNILELGSGAGTASLLLAEMGARSVTGVELDPELLETARRKSRERGLESRTEFLALDIEKYPAELARLIKERGTDLVFHFNFLEHMRDDRALLKTVHDALPDGGLLAGVLPAASGIYGRLDEGYRHYRRYDPPDLEHRFAPFTLEYSRRCAMLRYLGWRFAPAVRGSGFAGGWRLYNSFFFAADRLADRLLGRRLPFGAALIAVHRRSVRTA